MRYLVEFTGEHRLLPHAELNAIMEAFMFRFESVLDSPGAGIVDCREDLARIVQRPALCRSLSEFLFSVEAPSYESIWQCAGKKIPQTKGTFAIDSRRILGHHPDLSITELEKKIGSIVVGRSGNNARVNMENPDTRFKALLSKKFYFGKLYAEIDRTIFNTHHGRNRTFFSPISLHPKFARAMINLARLRPGMKVLDPFCGTGGILIEGASCGLEVYGSDISRKMVQGSKSNLELFNLPYADIVESDIEQSQNIFNGMDAVVTDPPYGRSSSTSGQAIDKLYSQTFTTVANILKNKGFFVVMLPDKSFIKSGEEIFNLIEEFSVYVHKSLTRHICVYQK